MNEPSYKQIYDDILSIIADVRCEPISKLSLETTINNDLGVYGDDWDDIINPILKKYPMEDCSAFNFTDHMRGEAEFSFPVILDLLILIPRLLVAALVFLFNKKMSNTILKYEFFEILGAKQDPLYIADIFNSAIKGKWEYAKKSDLDLQVLIK